MMWTDIDSANPQQHARLADEFHFHPLAIEDTGNPRELGVERLCLFLSEAFLVSVHAGPCQTIDQARELLKKRFGDQTPEPAMIAHAIADIIVDDYFPIRDRVDAFVERLERQDSRRSWQTLREALGVRRVAFATQRSISTQARLYFRDVLDHCQQIIESMDALGHLISETTDTRTAELSMRLDYATTIFSAVALVATPFVIMSGLD